MDFKTKYEQLRKFILDLYPHLSYYCKEKVEGFIPELQEQKDERIRETFINYVKSWQQGCCKWNTDKDFCKDAIIWLEEQGKLYEKPTRDQVWEYCSKISHEWWQMVMTTWKTLTDEEQSKYNQFIGFNDFSDMLMTITAGALFQLIDTGKLEYEEGSLLLEKPDDTPKPIEDVTCIRPTDMVEPKFNQGDYKEQVMSEMTDMITDYIKQNPTDNDEKRNVINYIRRETCCGFMDANSALIKLIKVLKARPIHIMDKSQNLKIEWEE